MNMQFRPAVRSQCYGLVGIAGPSGSGKTFSALRLATGLAAGKPIAMIDTEGRRGLHYADQFDFLHMDLTAPFSPERYVEAILAGVEAGAGVIIVDSMSHEHEGQGGILEQHEVELTRMAGDDFRKREQCKFSAWIKPKAAHNRFVNTVLQVQAHLIFCFRAKEKLKLVKNVKGKLEPVPQGWQPICSDRFEYEMLSMLVLPPNSGGIADLDAGPTKLQEQHKGIFRAGRQIDEGMGQALAEWAAGSDNASTRTAPAGNGVDLAALQTAGEVNAQNGMQALETWWKGLTKAQKAIIKPKLDGLKETAAQADASEPDDPFAEDDTPAEASQADGDTGEAEDPTPEDVAEANDRGAEIKKYYDQVAENFAEAKTDIEVSQVWDETKRWLAQTFGINGKHEQFAMFKALYDVRFAAVTSKKGK